MDKYEYKVRSEEIKTLIEKGNYAEAAEIADGIDWRRVRSVMMLCMISDLYKINRRYEDSRDLMLLAYDRRPGGRSIVYALCELSIKLGEFVQAVEYYKEFVQVAPRDSGRYVLQYKLYEAQEVSLEERIAVLEELKSRDYSEKWAYELAYLYHRVGLGAKCVEECDDLILWFGEGRYVLKAMELKMLHEPLTPEQQEKYDEARGVRRTAAGKSARESRGAGEDILSAPTVEITSGDMEDIQVKLMGVGKYDTINMQKELAENMRELWENTETEKKGTEKKGTEKKGREKTESAGDVPEADLDTPDEPAPEEPAARQNISQKPESEEVFFGGTTDLGTAAKRAVETMKTEAAQAGKQGGEVTDSLHREYEKILGMDYDGQISLSLPGTEQIDKEIEKQITGQIRLEDVLSEWERMKKDSEQKRLDEMRQKVLRQTGAMFTEFDASVRDGLLEKLEEGKAEESPADGEEPVETWDSPGEPEAEKTADAADTEAEAYPEEDYSGEDVPEENYPEEAGASEPEPEAYPEEDYPGEEDVSEEDYPEDADAAEEDYPEDADAAEEDYPEDADVAEEDYSGEEDASEEDYPEDEDVAEEDYPEDDPEDADGKEEKTGKKLRPFSPEEKELFGAYAQSSAAKEQILHAIDSISIASYTGNVLITGDEGMDTLTLAKNLVKEVQNTDKNFSGRIAKISGASLNKKDIGQTLDKLAGGALIVQKAGAISKDTANRLYRVLEQEERGIIVLLLDTKKAINAFLGENPALKQSFSVRVDVEALDNDTLVAYAKKYAREQEYSIDELGVLALHTRISDRQTSDHAVTVAEVKGIMDEAIRHANRKNLGHFFDILIAKRYDDEDMIILREKDFE